MTKGKLSKKLIQIDGSTGEGGGQILRSALALSLVTGQPFRITGIRAGRQKPGLMRQHLTAVKAAVDISDASIDGAEIGSTELVFHPGGVKPGEYRFAVGTAGSATLVLQTILPALIVGSTPSVLHLEGGTHNPYAPPFDFLAETFLPQLERLGPQVRAILHRPGFYPAGGGKMEIHIQPVEKLQPTDLHERGEIIHRHAEVRTAALEAHIAQREHEQLLKSLSWLPEQVTIEKLPAEYGPGNIIVLKLQSAQITEVICGFGERGVGTDTVVDRLRRSVRQYLTHGAPVGEYLADQLLLPFALAGGGSFTCGPLSRHAQTNIEVIQQFLPIEITVTEREHQRVVTLRS
jgi:RNA 3'-terminal phosphate cyclase (ATP)